jgi:hypothetical protein
MTCKHNNGKGMQWHSWLRHCATIQKVAGLIPDGVIGIFHWHNPSGCIVALGLTLKQKWVLGIFSGGYRRPVHRADNLTTFMCQLCLEIWEPQPPVQAFTFLYNNSHWTCRLLNNNYIKHIFWIFIKVLVLQSCFVCCGRKPWFNYISYLSHSSGVVRLAVGEWMLG